MKYPREFSLVLRLAGVAFLLIFLLSGTFQLTPNLKNRLIRTAVIALSVIALRYAEEKKKGEKAFWVLVFFALLFAGIFNAFFQFLTVCAVVSVVCLILFVFLATVKILLIYRIGRKRRAELFFYPSLGILSFLSLAA
ncbi:hypothetical protein JXA84_02755 [candidate division WOR-3 bacterium]|nr:hypothetical protein [candidate division WOR-3 bacterium]